jgi:hypothetical protein
VQTLDSKVLLTATVVEPPIIEPEIVDDPVAEPSVIEPPLAEPSTAEPPVAEPPNIDPPVVNASFGNVQVTVILGETLVTGDVIGFEGHVPSLTISFGGVLSGLDVDVQTNGTFSAMFSGEVSGLGIVTLLDSVGNQVDQIILTI